MKSSRIAGLISIILLLAPAFLGQNKPATRPPAPAAKAVFSGSGYITAGVEAGCLMLQDSQTKSLYNLFFATKGKPALGAAIHFTGTRHDGPTTCMQGEAVDVKRWSPLKTPPGTEKNRQ